MERVYRRLAAVVAVLICPCFGQQPAFDAASVKLVDPAAPASFVTTGGPGTSDPGRIHYGHATMIELLTKAFSVDIDQISGPMWVQSFMGPNFYIVDATMPPDTTKEQFQLMLQTLLKDRFHLEFHRETRAFPGYELVVAKGGPKLHQSAPHPESAAPSGPPRMGIGKDGFPIGRGAATGRGTYRMRAQEESMTDLVRSLGPMLSQALGADLSSQIVGAERVAPRPRVTDKTGLTGKYDFTLEFDCPGCRGLGAAAAMLPQLAARTPADGQPASAASEPAGSGLPTIFAAFEKQLGLRLEKVKDVPVEVVVIDRLDKVPVEN